MNTWSRARYIYISCSHNLSPINSKMHRHDIFFTRCYVYKPVKETTHQYHTFILQAVPIQPSLKLSSPHLVPLTYLLNLPMGSVCVRNVVRNSGGRGILELLLITCGQFLILCKAKLNEIGMAYEIWVIQCIYFTIDKILFREKMIVIQQCITIQ